MAEPTNSDDASHIAHIQRQTDEITALAAVGIEMIGGPAAVNIHLRKTLGKLIVMAINELGPLGARELMADGYIAADHFVE